MLSPKHEINPIPFSNNTLLPSNIYEVDINGRNTLHLLAMDGNLSALHDVLKIHSDVNLEVNDNNGQTPLNIAARHGYLEIVEVIKHVYVFLILMCVLTIEIGLKVVNRSFCYPINTFCIFLKNFQETYSEYILVICI